MAHAAIPPEGGLRIGVIGLGAAGAAMVPAILAHPWTVLAGAAEPDISLRARFSQDHSAPAVRDASDLLHRDDIDAVYIATPHHLHREHAVLAAAHGKHIIVEKPMALTLADCDSMIAAAGEANVTLIVGHTHSFDPAIAVMSDTVLRQEFGPLFMIAALNYTDFLYRPRRPEELDTARGGGILFNQLPHQVDVVRLLAGSPVRSVRAMTGVFDPARPTEGACMAFLDFYNGVAASIVYSGYDHFDSDELSAWVGEGGQMVAAHHGSARRTLRALTGEDEERRARKELYGYGSQSAARSSSHPHQPRFGFLVASCQNADLRQTADGVVAYTGEGVREIAIPASRGRPGRAQVLDELCASVLEGVQPVHNGAFARGTVETCLAIQQSSAARTEIHLETLGREN